MCIKYLKHGFGKVVDHATREIRLGRLTRKKAISLVKKFNHVAPRHDKLYFDWLGVTANSFYHVINQHKSSVFWEKNALLESQTVSSYLKQLQGSDNENALKTNQRIRFKLTKNNNKFDENDRYILIGKGL